MKQVLRAALDDRGYTTLTPVQEAVSDPALNGQDLLVSAQTGSGKTLGFGLAIAPTLLGDAERFDTPGAPLALVIAPTRELALQVKRELSWLFAGAGGVMASCVGGMDMRDERRALARGAHIVVATPGRLRDHIMRGSIDLTAIAAVVLDEADEMLDLGFREDLEFILGEAPQTRQTLLFSATVPKPIVALAQSYQQDARRIVVQSATDQHADIRYTAMHVAERDTENAVINTLLYHQAPNAIVFANTRAMVNRMTTRLSNRGFQVVALSGELTQSERTNALQAMRDGRAQVCVATDVAARGIDLPNLDLVVHAELPSNHETLLHRSGRTGRAGRKGVSALIVTKSSRKKAERILNWAKLKAEWTTAPSADAVRAKEEERLFADPAWTEPVAESEADVVGRLQETFSAEQLAAAYLRLYRAARSSPEDLVDPDAKPAPRPEFGPSVWFAITGGRAAGAEPRRVLPMLIKSSAVTRDEIGAIRIQQDRSLVQVKRDAAPKLRALLANGGEIEPGAVVTELAEAPVLTDGRPPHPPHKRPARADGPPKPHRGKRPPHGDRPGKAPASRPEAGEPRQTRADRPDAAQTESRQKPAATPKHGAKPAPKQADRTHKAAGGGAKALSEGATRPKTKPKGPPPPKGKSTSKKNKARTMAAKAKSKGPAHKTK
ncbi:DEAD/DEAH box helicase [Cognatishimia sp. F0-27]|uniref:DEAD/DEAH box helicase n=1 Tax=Cognatishimia sp. F0-27 TaxID=2816855 RepID=UPI001D0C0062|nr:DEAD/DEAH box helicase [Cognatishimia sp. F0-27]MCC1491843.1 DEAD/DEAH box helicase [Cognatishimia sp. F0-27]